MDMCLPQQLRTTTFTMPRSLTLFTTSSGVLVPLPSTDLPTTQVLVTKAFEYLATSLTALDSLHAGMLKIHTILRTEKARGRAIALLEPPPSRAAIVDFFHSTDFTVQFCNFEDKRWRDVQGDRAQDGMMLLSHRLAFAIEDSVRTCRLSISTEIS